MIKKGTVILHKSQKELRLLDIQGMLCCSSTVPLNNWSSRIIMHIYDFAPLASHITRLYTDYQGEYNDSDWDSTTNLDTL